MLNKSIIVSSSKKVCKLIDSRKPFLFLVRKTNFAARSILLVFVDAVFFLLTNGSPLMIFHSVKKY